MFGQIGLEADFWSIETLNGELAQHPEIRDVFFEGENYVLVGLYKARLLLENESVGSDSLDKKMVGRDTELNAIKEFVAFFSESNPPSMGGSRKKLLKFSPFKRTTTDLRMHRRSSVITPESIVICVSFS